MKPILILSLLTLVVVGSAAEVSYDLPGVNIRDYALSKDGNELYLTMESIGKDASQIIRLKKESDGWSEPTMASFSGQFKDLEPFLHPNGLQLFFASNRNAEQTGINKNFDIWVVNRAEETASWGLPIRLGNQINSTEGDEFYPSVANNGNLYFTATKPTGLGKEDIYVSLWLDPGYSNAELLPQAINSETYEFNAYINPTEDMLIFSSYGRKDGMGGGDLYVSHKVDDQWQTAVNLGPEINSKQLDYCPYYDSVYKQFYWTSNKSVLSNTFINKMDFKQWYQTMTSGSNGMSKIYTIKKEISPHPESSKNL